MKTRKIFSIVGLLAFVSLTACVDDRFSSLNVLNEEPVIYISTEDDDVVTDSMKVSLKHGTEEYAFSVKYYDNGGARVSSISAQVDGGELLQNGTTVGNSLDLTTSSEIEGSVPLVFKNQGLTVSRLYSINFTVRDASGSSDQVTLQVVAFNNLPPVGTFTFEKLATTSAYEYQFDARQSKDLDEKFGGAIQAYRWKINGANEFYTTNGLIRHVFPGPGGYEMELTAFDNDGASSTPIKKLVTVQ